MSQETSPTDDAFEQQQRILHQGQEAVTAAMELPVRQAAQLQRNAAEFLMNGLDLVESTQRMGTDVTRTMFRSFLDASEAALAQGGRQFRSQGSGPGTPSGGSMPRSPGEATQQAPGGQVPSGEIEAQQTPAGGQYQHQPTLSGPPMEPRSGDRPPGQQPMSGGQPSGEQPHTPAPIGQQPPPGQGQQGPTGQSGRPGTPPQGPVVPEGGPPSENERRPGPAPQP